MKKHISEAVEITTFRLNGYSCKEFIEANKETDQFLKAQKGFKSRRIFEQSGLITDMLIWENAENGTAAMHKLMSALSDSKVHAMINQNTVVWNIANVEHFIENQSL